jgi:hypothetical protein
VEPDVDSVVFADRPSLPAAFYCVSDSNHFLGFVALVNSLRLAGHREPVVLVDAGLLPEQRSMLAGHVTLVPAPTDAHVIFLKQHGPRVYPAEVMILLDSDIIVVRPLDDLVDAAEKGRLVAFVDNEPDADRFFPEWAEALGVDSVRMHPYVNAGQVIVPFALAERVFSAWGDGQANIDVGQTWHARVERGSNPFYFGDQDVLNAVIGGCLEPEEVVILGNKMAPNPPFRGLRLVDARAVHCEYADGSQPYLLHHFLAKPWLSITPASVYSRLMTRLLLAPDVSIRMAPDLLPLRLREGRLAAIDRFRASTQARLRAGARRGIGRFRIRTRLAGLRRTSR